VTSFLESRHFKAAELVAAWKGRGEKGLLQRFKVQTVKERERERERDERADRNRIQNGCKRINCCLKLIAESDESAVEDDG
jgi:hypothetical protein